MAMSESDITPESDTAVPSPGKEQGAATPAPQAAAQPANQTKFAHTEIRGRINQYTSGYWALAIPALMARYVARYCMALFGIQDLDKTPNNVPIPGGSKLKKLYAGAVGLWMTSITTVYAYQTWKDMKRIFADTLSYEFGKKPEDIGFGDFRKSKNIIIKHTMHNFYLRNALRGGVSLSFFARFLPGPFKRHTADSVDLGTGLTGTYLVSDVLLRKETFFEKLQGLTDQKINHRDRLGDVITGTDILNLFDRYRRDNGTDYVMPRMDSPEWQNNLALFDRMADLMNQTYGNAVNKDNAQFTIPKFIYLLGEGLIDPAKPEQSMAYIELASRNDNMQAVKQVMADVAAGKTMQAAIQPYALPLAGAEAGEALPETSFAAQLEPKSPTQPATVPPASFTQKHLEQQNNAAALQVGA